MAQFQKAKGHGTWMDFIDVDPLMWEKWTLGNS